MIETPDSTIHLTAAALTAGGINDDADNLCDVGRQTALTNRVFGNEPEQIRATEEPVHCVAHLFPQPGGRCLEAIGYQPRMRVNQFLERSRITSVDCGNSRRDVAIGPDETFTLAGSPVVGRLARNANGSSKEDTR